MKKRQVFTIILVIAILAVVVGIQACGKSGGNGVGGNIQFYGAGS